MKSLFKLLLTLCLFALLPFAVSAQSLTGQSVDLGNRTSINIPADWQIAENETGFFTFAGDSFTNRPMTVEVMTPTYLRSLGINFTSNLNATDVVIALTTLFDGYEPDDGEVQKTLYDDRAAASFILRDAETTDTLNVGLTLNDGSFGYLTVTVGNGQLIALNSQITAIIASFDTTRTATVTGTVTGALASSASCTVSADGADTAQLRVGPGTNRGAISFLPADTDVTATGRIELDDGSVWYQLDIDEAAPNGTPAAELWVFEDDVNLSGDCLNIGETSAPPIVRAAPQNGNSTSTGTQTTETTSTSSTPATGLLQPIAGEYTLSLEPIFNASCEGYNMPFSASEYYEGVMTYIYYVVTVDANSFYFGEDLYTRYPGSNSYDGIFTYEDGSFSYARLDVLAPGQLHGEANHSYEIDGYNCHATMMFNSTLN